MKSKTIKQKVFISLKKKYKTSSFNLKDIRREIWIAQGKDPKKFFNKQGYYMVGINGWVGDKLLSRRKKNTYTLNFVGYLYADNPTKTNRILKAIEDRKRERRKKAINNHVDNFRELVGKRIVSIRRLTTDECADLRWYNRPLVLELDDNTCLIPQTDDEGNDGGAMWHYDYRQREGYVKEEVVYTT